MKEHEHPYWKETLQRAKPREEAGYELPGHYKKMKEHVAENYHDRTEPQKRAADEERYQYESRHRAGLGADE